MPEDLHPNKTADRNFTQRVCPMIKDLKARTEGGRA